MQHVCVCNMLYSMFSVTCRTWLVMRRVSSNSNKVVSCGIYCTYHVLCTWHVTHFSMWWDMLRACSTHLFVYRMRWSHCVYCTIPVHSLSYDGRMSRVCDTLSRTRAVRHVSRDDTYHVTRECVSCVLWPRTVRRVNICHVRVTQDVTCTCAWHDVIHHVTVTVTCTWPAYAMCAWHCVCPSIACNHRAPEYKQTVHQLLLWCWEYLILLSNNHRLRVSLPHVRIHTTQKEN